jgi:hypothetical protein
MFLKLEWPKDMDLLMIADISSCCSQATQPSSAFQHVEWWDVKTVREFRHKDLQIL